MTFAKQNYSIPIIFVEHLLFLYKIISGMIKNTGLVLEGGGFRGLYSAGFLDFFLEKNIEFPYIIGVSMGACNAVNYISKQQGRNLDIPYTFINDKRYMSYCRLLAKGELFGMDFVYDTIPNQLNPFDFQSFNASTQDFIIVTTDCEKGNPVYFKNLKNGEMLKALQASTSLPFASKMVTIDDKLLLDGGICDPIPIERALEDGNKKLVVILTQPADYRKKPARLKYMSHWKYKAYPALTDKLLSRHQKYNDTIDQLEKLESEGKAFVIRPDMKIPISRTEKNVHKLKEAFEMGYKQAHEIWPALSDFLEK